MEFDNTPGQSLTLPVGAGPGDVHMVLGTDIPAPLQAFYTALGDPIVEAEVMFDGLGDFVYTALTDSGTKVTGVYDFGNNRIRQRSSDLPTLLQWALADFEFTPPDSLQSESWNLVTLANGWANTGGSDCRLSYKRVSLGAVWLTGRINSPNPFNATIGQLPATGFSPGVNYRPISNQFVPAERVNVTGVGLRVVVDTNGVLTAAGDTTVSVAWWVNGIFPIDVS